MAAWLATLGIWVVCMVSTAALAQDSTPVVTDSRIKTFVYNENDVYSLLTHYGYQSNVEFGKHEVVRTVSVGDRVAWQVVPAGRRLFIKALEEKAHTNMTVVTNKRAYQFDLRSSGRVPLHPNEELVYVVRFYYPTEQDNIALPPLFSDQTPIEEPVKPAPVEDVISSQNAFIPPMHQVSQPFPQNDMVMPTTTRGSQQIFNSSQPFNMQYTYSGPDAIAPLRIYDNGSQTFFTFPQHVSQNIQFFQLYPNGGLAPLSASRLADGQIAIPAIVPQMVLRSGGQQLVVYNEQLTGT